MITSEYTYLNSATYNEKPAINLQLAEETSSISHRLYTSPHPFTVPLRRPYPH